MDGVCADFITPALTLLDLAPKATLDRWRTEYAGDFYPEALMGMSREVFFDRIDAHGASFWRKLPAYSWFPGLHSDLASLGDVMFLSAPTGYPACLAGKYAWLCDFFGSHYRDCIFTLHKDRLAHHRAILIDDSDQNIEAFRRRGGHGIVFPQVWNSAGACNEPAAHVVAAVSALIKASA